MAKTDPKTIANTEAEAPAPRMGLPRMGDTVLVMLANGSRLLNNETGGYFEEGAPTPQTVTVTLHRRLVDGDLVLVG